MNTVFKMGYQAWILLAIFGAVALVTTRPRIPRILWTAVALVLTAVGVAYAYGGTSASRNTFKDEPGLDGRKWLEPGDQAVIRWIREEIDDGAVVLEAVGDDYSAFGHGRISVYTGRPTVMGWQGHELQWNRDPGVIAARATDVQTLYTSPDPAQVRDLLERYDVDYAVVGGLERTTYGPPRELASYPTVFEKSGVRVIAVGG